MFSVDVCPQSGKSFLSGKSIRDPSGDVVRRLLSVPCKGGKGLLELSGTEGLRIECILPSWAESGLSVPKYWSGELDSSFLLLCPPPRNTSWETTSVDEFF